MADATETGAAAGAPGQVRVSPLEDLCRLSIIALKHRAAPCRACGCANVHKRAVPYVICLPWPIAASLLPGLPQCRIHFTLTRSPFVAFVCQEYTLRLAPAEDAQRRFIGSFPLVRRLQSSKGGWVPSGHLHMAELECRTQRRCTGTLCCCQKPTLTPVRHLPQEILFAWPAQGPPGFREKKQAKWTMTQEAAATAAAPRGPAARYHHMPQQLSQLHVSGRYGRC